MMDRRVVTSRAIALYTEVEEGGLGTRLLYYYSLFKFYCGTYVKFYIPSFEIILFLSLAASAMDSSVAVL